MSWEALGWRKASRGGELASSSFSCSDGGSVLICDAVCPPLLSLASLAERRTGLTDGCTRQCLAALFSRQCLPASGELLLLLLARLRPMQTSIKLKEGKIIERPYERFVRRYQGHLNYQTSAVKIDGF